MSLFRMVEYVSSRIDHISCLTVGRLSSIQDRDQVLIGTEDGNIVIVDVASAKQQARPTSGNPAMMQDGVILHHHVGLPILQVDMGQFVANYSNHTIVVLTPKMLIMYDVQKGEADELMLQQMYSHNLTETAYKMISIPTKDKYSHLLVMGIGASISIYDGEQCVLSRVLSTSLHPGPVAMCHMTSSIITGSSGTVKSVKYSLLASHGVGGKKLNFDWSRAVGDTVIDIKITQNETESMIMTLCRRRLVALTTGGMMHFSFDLQCIGLALKSFSHAITSIISLVTTNTGDVLVLKNNVLMWTSKTPFVAKYLELADAREVNCMIAIADDNRVHGYLGTEPSLYRIPIAPNRSVDYAAKKEQMALFEEQIRQFSGSGSDANAKPAMRELTATLDPGMTMDYTSRTNSKTGDNTPVPSCTIRLRLPNDLKNVQVNVNCDIGTTQKAYWIDDSTHESVIPMTFFIDDQPPIDPHITVAVHCESMMVFLEASLPLSTIAIPCPVVRQAAHKVTLDVEGPTHSLIDLLPDIATSPSHASQIGLLMLTTDVVVCIWTAGKSNRYRIQSDSLDYLYLVTVKLLEAVKYKNPDVRVNVNFAVSAAVQAAEDYVELETEYEKEKEALTKNSAEVRAMQAVLIPMTRNTKYQPLENLTLLIENTYNKKDGREVTSTVSELDISEEELEKKYHGSCADLLDSPSIEAKEHLTSSLQAMIIKLVPRYAGVTFGRVKSDDRLIRGGIFCATVTDGAEASLLADFIGGHLLGVCPLKSERDKYVLMVHTANSQIPEALCKTGYRRTHKSLSTLTTLEIAFPLIGAPYDEEESYWVSLLNLPPGVLRKDEVVRAILGPFDYERYDIKLDRGEVHESTEDCDKIHAVLDRTPILGTVIRVRNGF